MSKLSNMFLIACFCMGCYLYDTQGTKLRKYSTQGGNRDYVGGIEYNGAVIELIHTRAGVAYRNSSGTNTYRYNLTDHQGNVG